MMSTKNARRRNFAAIIERAGITGRFTPHHLRHTFSSLHHLIGTPERVTSAGMGHADSQITRQVYTHAIDGEHRLATEKLDRLIRTGTTSRRRLRASVGLTVVRRGDG
jgi:integrase